MNSQAEQYHRVGIEQLQSGAFLAAVESFDRAIVLDPSAATYRGLKGVALYSLGRYQEAERTLRKAVHLSPKDVPLRVNLAIALEHCQRPTEALEQYDLALEIDHGFGGARLNRGSLLMALGRFDAAVENNRRLVQLRPEWPEAQFNLGDALLASGRWTEALDACEKALELRPGYGRARFNKAVVLSMQGAFERAADIFNDLKKEDPETYWDSLDKASKWGGCGTRLRDPAPQLFYLLGMYGKQSLCDWREWPLYVERFRTWIDEGAPFMVDHGLVFPALTQPLGGVRHLAFCKAIAESVVAEAGEPLPAPPRSIREKIRVAYVSPDFRFHPVARLTRQLYGLHDRSRFEVYAYSLRPDDGSELHRSIRAGCDRFIEATSLDARSLAERIRDDGIDILVDLAGYTTFNRMGAFALRPSPVQVTYFGFPSTTGATFFDYTFVDEVVSPPGSERFYSEHLVRFPHSYAFYDNEQEIGISPGRREMGLPEKGTVFCCFNNSYKIEPEIFSVWMRILAQVPGSVLWLLRSREGVEENLRREAVLRGVSPDRLVFAPFVPNSASHLARYRVADLFLDTVVCNAHATASDSLWAGLPVLTCPSESQWSRLAASLLTSIGLPDLIVDSLEQYEKMAVRLGSCPEERAKLKGRLAHNRRTYPLFDTKGYVRHLEQAYLTMWERHLAGQPPESFSLPD